MRRSDAIFNGLLMLAMFWLAVIGLIRVAVLAFEWLRN